MKFSDIIENLLEVAQSVVILIMSLSLLVFLWGILKYILKYGDEKARSESIKIMSYGIIGLFIMVAVWGLVELFTSLIGEEVSIPQF